MLQKTQLYAALFLFLWCSITGRSQSSPGVLADELQRYFDAEISYHSATQYVNFIRFSDTKSLPLLGNSRIAKVASFIEQYGGLWHIETIDEVLRLSEQKTDIAGHHHLYFDQKSDELPVFDGGLRFHFDEANRLIAVNGIFIPEIALSSIPEFTASEAAQMAITQLEKQFLHTISPALEVNKSDLLYFKKSLAEGKPGGEIHLVYEIELTNHANVRETLFIDAHHGFLVAQYTGMCTALFRRVYEGTTATQVWQEGDALPGTLSIWQQNEVNVSKHMYDLFVNAFSYTSYDDADAEMRSINNAAGISCPNANWNGQTANYCDGTAADDVIAHEWGHAYTEYTSNLIYAWQAGAINESYSDIWGETVDLINGYGTDTNDHLARTACNSGIRWMMGEDATSFGSPIRDMWDPTCKNDPGKISDSQYHCSATDNGGVHSNSGIPNHAYALLVDGGTYNGQTITALGMTKAAHIFWQAQKNYLVRTTDFAALADALEASCTDLLSVNLPTLSLSTPGLSGQIITPADCVELAKVITAVEMRNATACTPSQMFDPSIQDLCNPGTEILVKVFEEDFENGSTGWIATQEPVNLLTWTPRDWSVINNLPDNRSGSGMYGPNSFVGDCITDLENGILRLESPSITIPGVLTSDLYMRFDHYLSIENRWDGGNLKYQRNGGAWTFIPGTAFIDNGYISTLHTFPNNDNPLQGQSTFTGANGGSVTGSWGTSQINLSDLGVVAGDIIKIRWELGEDGCNGWDGWYLDDIDIGFCALAIVPVEWLSFDLHPQKQHFDLKWTTAAEQNNDYFEIQRSDENNQVFKTISTVAGAGTTTIEQAYTYRDDDVVAGLRYLYRLKQIDADGVFSYSPIRNGILGTAFLDFELVPNPTTSETTLFFPEIKAGTITIFSANGKEMVSIQKAENDNKIRLPLEKFPAGVYWVKVVVDGQVKVKSLLVL